MWNRMMWLEYKLFRIFEVKGSGSKWLKRRKVVEKEEFGMIFM